MPETILQFGTGRFLRCFVDLFVDELNRAGKAAGSIVVVQSTGGDVAATINRQGGRFHAAIRGRRDGRIVDQVAEVASVSRTIAAGPDWPAVLNAARSPSLAVVVSNVTEAGYSVDPGDEPGVAPPRSFPAKLLAVLAARHREGLPGLAILPCELLENNAGHLRGLVLEQADRWRLDAKTVEWIRDACSWHDTLVDRIVSAPGPNDPWAQRDPLFAVAEPYAFWGISGRPVCGDLTCHEAVRLVDDLTPYALRKVRLLNGAHTALVAKALPLGFTTVRQALENAEVRDWLRRLLFEEIVPVLEGRTDSPREFAETVLERFANPFLEHRLADIAMHHDVKLQTRLAPTLAEYRAKFVRTPPLLGQLFDAGRVQ